MGIGYSLWGVPVELPHGISMGIPFGDSMGMSLGNSHGGFKSDTGVVWSYFQFPFPY